MNALQTLTALTLHEGGANNKTFDRLQRRFMSIGHKSLISLQDQLCEGFDSEVRKWQEDVVKESAAEAELVDILQKYQWFAFHRQIHSGKYFSELGSIGSPP